MLHVVDEEAGTVAEAPFEQIVPTTTLDRAKLLAAHIADAHQIIKLRAALDDETAWAYVSMMFTEDNLLALIFPFVPPAPPPPPKE